MKKLVTILSILLMAISALAQSPQGFTYQAVVRNTDGTFVSNRQISVRLGIHQGSATGTEAYAETHRPTTTAEGLFTIMVGQGASLVNCTFENCIDWENGPWFLKTEVDPNGGSNYTLTTTQQLMSVPYALYALKAGNATNSGISSTTVRNMIDSTANILRQQIVALQASRDSADTSITNINQYITVIDGRLSVSDSLFNILRHRIDSTGNSISSLNQNVTVINGRLSSTDSLLNVLRNRIDSTDSHVSVINQNIASMNQRMSAFDTLLNRLYTRIDSIQISVDSIAAGNVVHDTLILRYTTIIRDSVIVFRDTVLITDTNNSNPYDVAGTLPGVFSISAVNKIAFSRGNLQYKASTNTWRFAEHQYDIVGTANLNISSSYNGWIDLFGYGTSGYNSKYPYSTSTSSSYYPSGPITNTNYDWGKYNRISNGGDSAGIWRTLTKEEWTYILSSRTNAAQLKTFATVANTPGLILLPDNWTADTTITLVANVSTNFTTNVYTVEQWRTLQNKGAVFLPAAGYRSGSSVTNTTTGGYYWTSSSINNSASSTCIQYIYFTNNTAPIFSPSNSTYYSNTMGNAVRLARDLTVIP